MLWVILVIVLLNLILTLYGLVEFGASVDEIKYVLHLPNNIEKLPKEDKK